MVVIIHLTVALIAVLLFSFLPGFGRWREWFFSPDAFRPVRWSYDRVSPILVCVATALWVLRRLSLWENIKHLWKSTVPWMLDTYLIACWVVVFGLTGWTSQHEPLSCFSWIALFVVLQIAQTNFYHEFWRTMYTREGEDNIAGEDSVNTKVSSQTESQTNQSIGVFNRLRNLVIAFSSLAMVTWLLGLVYWWNRQQGFNNELHTVWDAIYFSFLTGSTLGFGEIHPVVDAGLLQACVVFQVAVSLFLIAALLGQCVTGVGPLAELPERNSGPSSGLDSDNVSQRIGQTPQLYGVKIDFGWISTQVFRNDGRDFGWGSSAFCHSCGR